MNNHDNNQNTTTKNNSDEVRWIECEAHLDNRTDKDDGVGANFVSGIRGDQHSHADVDNVEGEKDLVDGIGGLFADPDPMDFFQFEFDVDKSKSIEGTQRINVILQGVKAENGQLLNSTGLTVWRASRLLCNYMVKHPEVVENNRVVELGAGLGVCGIVANKLGAKTVIMTDGDSDVLCQMRKNVSLNYAHILNSSGTKISNNNHEGVNANTPKNNAIHCRQLIWGEQYAVDFLKWHDEQIMVSNKKMADCEDANKIQKETGIDVIIGSDIIYTEEAINPLFDTVSVLLSQQSLSRNRKENAKFMLAYARRNVNIHNVLKSAKRHGLEWTSPDDMEGVFVFTNKSSNSLDNTQQFNII